jgi:hypothetical protein
LPVAGAASDSKFITICACVVKQARHNKLAMLRRNRRAMMGCFKLVDTHES